MLTIFKMCNSLCTSYFINVKELCAKYISKRLLKLCHFSYGYAQRKKQKLQKIRKII